MNRIHQSLNPNESVVWEGRPQLLPFLINPTAVGLFIIFIAMGIWSIVKLDDAGPIVLLFVILALTVPWVAQYVVYYRTYYAVTSQRVVIQNGLAGADITSFDYDKITSASLTVSVIDKLFATGTIIINSASRARRQQIFLTPPADRFISISQPHAVHQMLLKTMTDSKTDLMYPNAYRHEGNPGYQTTYATDLAPGPEEQTQWTIEIPGSNKS